MYSLMLLLSLLTAAAFLHVFAFRRRGYLPAFVVVPRPARVHPQLGPLHGRGLARRAHPVLVRVRGPARVSCATPLIGFGGVGLLYLPWVPTLLHQIQHTGAPWLNSPNFGAPVQISKGLLGGGTPTVALLLAGGSGIAVILQRRVDDRERTAVIAGLLVPLATLAVAWLVSQVSPAWTTRYLGVILGPLLLVSAVGLARAGKLGLVALVIVLGIWAIPRTFGLTNKSNAADLRDRVGAASSTRATSCCRCSPSRGRCSSTTSSASGARRS